MTRGVYSKNASAKETIKQPKERRRTVVMSVNNVRKKVEGRTGRSWKITPEQSRACKQKETKRKSDIWKETSGQERDLYFLFSSPVLTRCDVPAVPVGPVGSCLHYSQNFPSPRLLPSDPEI